MSANKESITIIGAGITGLASALVLAESGYKVRLIDRQAPATETSDNTLRVIHGGLRYLQDFDLFRSIRSIRAQREFERRFPKFLCKLPCLMPLSTSGLKSRIPVFFAIHFYNLLYRIASSSSHGGSVLKPEEVMGEVPLLKDYNPLPGALYWEDLLLVSHSNLAEELLRQLDKLGVVSDFNAEIESVSYEKNRWSLNCNNGLSFDSGVVIECTGPQLGIKIKGSPAPRQLLLKAYNLELNKSFESRYAIGFSGNNRLFFMVPRGDLSSIGTWYSDQVVPPGAPLEVSTGEKQVAIDQVNQAFPALKLSMEHVRGVDVGLLPAIAKNNKMEVVGSEKIFSDKNYYSVLSTKYTTAFEVAGGLLKRIKKKSA